jgi:hypothetical protein
MDGIFSKFRYLLIVLGGIITGTLIVALFFTKALLLVLGLVVVFLIMMRPDIGLLLTVGSLIFGYTTALLPEKFIVTMSVQKVFGILTFVSWVLNRSVKKSRIVELKDLLIPQNKILAGFILTIVISLFFAEMAGDGFRRFNSMLALVMFYFLVYKMVDSEKFFRRLLAVFVISSVLIACFSVVQPFVFKGRSEYNVAQIGPFEDPSEQHSTGTLYRSSGLYHADSLAINMVIVIPLLLFFFRSQRSLILKFIIILALIASLGALVLSFSRAAVFSLLLIFPFIILRQIVKVSPAFIIVVVSIALGAALLVPNKFTDRVFSVKNIKESKGLEARKKMWGTAFDMFKDYWLTGVGFGSFDEHLPRYSDDEYVKVYTELGNPVGPHNLFMEVAAEQGASGLIALVVFFGTAIGGFWRGRRRFKAAGNSDMATLSSALELGLIAFIISNLAHVTILHNKEIWFVLACPLVLNKLASLKDMTLLDDQRKES